MDHEQFVVRPRVRCELAQVPQLSLRSRKGERAGCGSRVDRVRFGRWARIASSDKWLEDRTAPTFHTTARACGGWRGGRAAPLLAGVPARRTVGDHCRATAIQVSANAGISWLCGHE